MTPPNVAIYNWIRQSFDFRTRSTRSDYWWPRLFIFVVNLVLMFLFFSAIGTDASVALLEWMSSENPDLAELDIGPLSSLALFVLTFFFVFWLLTLIPSISVSWRRYQDMGRPGWIHLLFLIAGAFLPFARLAEFIWFAFPGTKGPNQYGPDPLDESPDIF